uniref:Pep_M12B_propep domain-containing protein n=1 Tax=Angiostrongylus cantonensis TaxID=6313 RepID=A0A0K0DHD7_ANGCA
MRMETVSQDSCLQHVSSVGTCFFSSKKAAAEMESPNDMIHVETDYILKNRKLFSLDTSTVQPYCTGSDHGLLRAKIGISRKLEMNLCYWP